MESLSEHEAMRVLQAAAAMDAMRATGARSNALAASWSPSAPQQQPQQPPSGSEVPPSPAQGLGEDVWREMAEADGGESRRHGDLDTWTDVFRATASSVRNAWRHVESLSYEPLALGWLALARKHEPLAVAPAAACGEDITALAAAAAAAGAGPAETSALPGWLGEAQWVLAANQWGHDRQRLGQVLGLQTSDILALQPDSSGWGPGFLLAVHHDSRTVRLVVRGNGAPRDLLTHLAAGHSAALGAGFAHHGLLCGAQQLLQEAGEGLRGALEGHPGYGLHVMGHSLGAGTAALLALLISLDPPSALGGGAAGVAGVAVRATCFGPPPVVTAELAEQCAGCVESVVYNADLVSRCSVLSLRRLATEVRGASEEVLARSELAQTLRRSGALGLANHLVAAALCRWQAHQENAPTGGTLPRPGGPEGLSGLVRPTATAIITHVAQPNGRAPQLATLGSPHKAAGVATGGAAGSPVAALDLKATCAAAVNGSPSPLPPPAPVGPPNGTLPPLAAAAGASGVSGNGAVRAAATESPLRKGTDTQGVLSPPPLVAAAAAAASAQTAAVAAVAATATAGPTPPRRALIGALGDLKAMSQHDLGRGLAGAAVASATSAFAAASGTLAPGACTDDGSCGGTAGRPPWPEGALPAGGAGVLLGPLPVLPALPLPQPGGVVAGIAVPAGIPGGPRRDPGVGVPDGVAAAPLPPLLPPLLLPAVNGSASSLSRSQSPKPSRQTSLREPLPPPPLAANAASPSAAAAAPSAAVPVAEQVMVAAGTDPAASLQRQSPQPQPATTTMTQQPQQQAGMGQQQAGQQQQQDGGEAAGAVAAAVQPALQYHELLVPGCVCMLERRGADATASFRVLRDFGRTQLNRILLKRSMLRDHLLSHYMTALERITNQQPQQPH